MKPILIIAILLIGLGVVAFAYQGITYTTREKVVDFGPIQVMAGRACLQTPACRDGGQSGCMTRNRPQDNAGSFSKAGDAVRRLTGPIPEGWGGGLCDAALTFLSGHPARLRSVALPHLPGAPSAARASLKTRLRPKRFHYRPLWEVSRSCAALCC